MSGDFVTPGSGPRTTRLRPIPRLVCANGHSFHTAFPASWSGTPCPTCAAPLKRATS